MKNEYYKYLMYANVLSNKNLHDFSALSETDKEEVFIHAMETRKMILGNCSPEYREKELDKILVRHNKS